MPSPGADYGMGFEPLGPSAIFYATWEDSPEQIRGRLFWLEQSGKVGNGNNFKIADMRARGHLWAQTDRNPVPGLTPAGEALRLAAEQHNARLLVVDTLGVAYGASEIDRAQVGAFFADWAAWADEHDCAVLLIAHPPKDCRRHIFGVDGHPGRRASHVDHRECPEGMPRQLQLSEKLHLRAGLRLSPREREAELQREDRLSLAHEPAWGLDGKSGTGTRLRREGAAAGRVR